MMASSSSESPASVKFASVLLLWTMAGQRHLHRRMTRIFTDFNGRAVDVADDSLARAQDFGACHDHCQRQLPVDRLNQIADPKLVING